MIVFGTIKVSGETGTAFDPGNGVGGLQYLVVVMVQVFPDHLVVNACHHRVHHAVSVVIEMVYRNGSSSSGSGGMPFVGV